VKAQEIATAKLTPVSPTYETGKLVQRFNEISALPMLDRRKFFNSALAEEKSELWKLHLALHLVRRSNWDRVQVRIILDAISLSSAELFAVTNETTAAKTSADALRSITQRALSAFPKNEAAQIFANIGGEKPEDAILKKYSDISALPLKKRRVFFRRASANDKSDLWRIHLALYLVKRPELNEWQKEIILTAMSLATPACFELQRSNPAWKVTMGDPLRALEEQIVVAFSLEDGANIFATLGDVTLSAKGNPDRADSVWLKTVDYNPLTDSSASQPWTLSRFAVQEMMEESSPCECSTSSDWCPLGSGCSAGNCNATQSGCGTLWSHPCNGASCR
jgi:hypothetical protein